jgi:hypothetical protein
MRRPGSRGVVRVAYSCRRSAPDAAAGQDLAGFADRLQRRICVNHRSGELVRTQRLVPRGSCLTRVENTFRTRRRGRADRLRSNAAGADRAVDAAFAIAMAIVAAASFALRRRHRGAHRPRWGPAAVAARRPLESLAPVVVGAVPGTVATALMRRGSTAPWTGRPGPGVAGGHRRARRSSDSGRLRRLLRRTARTSGPAAK